MLRWFTPFLVSVFLCGGCGIAEGVKGDGVVRSEVRAIPEFSKVTVAGSFDVQWTPGKPGLSLSSDQNLLPLIVTAVEGDTLRITSTKAIQPASGLSKVVVSGGSLTDVQVSGDILFGASRLSGERLAIQTAGDASLTLDGTVASFSAKLVGDSRILARDLVTQTTEVQIVGDGNADVTAATLLKVSVIGDGTVTYGGSPKVEKTGIGSNNVRPR